MLASSHPDLRLRVFINFSSQNYFTGRVSIFFHGPGRTTTRFFFGAGPFLKEGSPSKENNIKQLTQYAAQLPKCNKLLFKIGLEISNFSGASTSAAIPALNHQRWLSIKTHFSTPAVRGIVAASVQYYLPVVQIASLVKLLKFPSIFFRS